MDLFVEQIVEKKKSIKEKVLQILIWLVAVNLIALLLVMTFYVTFNILCFLGMVGTAFGAYKLSNQFNIEYEYAVTNGYFDIDKIVAKSKRQRMLSTTCRDFETFGRYDEKKHAGKNYSTRLFACSEDEEDKWYVTLHSKENGHMLIVFTPNEKILAALKKYIPRQVAGDAFGN